METKKLLTLKTPNFYRISKFTMLIIGLLLITISAVYPSSFLAIFGTALIFWAIILHYIAPEKRVPLSFVTASTSNNENIERLLNYFALTQKGIYLPPQNLKNMESSLIFIPKSADAKLPNSEEITDLLFCKGDKGLLLGPPGLGLSELFEKELNVSFTKTDLKFLQLNLPKLFIEYLEIADEIELSAEGNIITVEVSGSIFNAECEKANQYPRVHGQVGCLLSSALACVLAKAIGKPIVISNEVSNNESNSVSIQFLVMETIATEPLPQQRGYFW